MIPCLLSVYKALQLLGWQLPLMLPDCDCSGATSTADTAPESINTFCACRLSETLLAV